MKVGLAVLLDGVKPLNPLEKLIEKLHFYRQFYAEEKARRMREYDRKHPKEK
jgi:hypothetical protein